MRRLIPPLLFALLLTGCGTDKPADAGTQALEQARTKGLSFQAGVLSDRTVSRPEYSDAVARTISCLKQAGVRVYGPRPDPNGVLLQYEFDAADGPDGAQSKAHVRCRDTYLDLVENVFFEDSRSDIEAAENRIFTTVVACFAERGIKPGSERKLSARVAGLRELHPRDFHECYLKATGQGADVIPPSASAPPES